MTSILTYDSYLNNFHFFIGSEKVWNFWSVQQAVDVLQKHFLFKLRVGDQEYSRLVQAAGVLQ